MAKAAKILSPHRWGRPGQAELTANPPGDSRAVPVLPLKPRQHHPGLNSCSVFHLQQLLRCCRQQGMQGPTCPEDAGAAAAPGMSPRVSVASSGPQERATPVTCWPPARARRKNQRRICAAEPVPGAPCCPFLLCPCATQTPPGVLHQVSSPGDLVPPPAWGSCWWKDQKCCDFSTQCRWNGNAGGWRGGGCS